MSRERIIDPGPTVVGYESSYTSPTPVARTQRLSYSREVLISSGHKRSSKIRDYGGEFHHWKHEMWSEPTANVRLGRDGSTWLLFEGRACTALPLPTNQPLLLNNIDSWGPTAYNRMKPTKPIFEGFTSVMELKEAPKLLLQRFTRDLRGISNYWVAIQFGWKPLLRDLRTLYFFQRDLEKRLAQLIRDNGRPVRRSIQLLQERTADSVSTGNSTGAFTVPTQSRFYPTPTASTITTRSYEERRVWASARFRYHLPSGPRGILWRRSMVARLLGAYPSPAAVWNGLPWTWLIDWFSSVGDTLSNMDAGVADRLAADYFYLMSERAVYHERTASGVFYVKDTSSRVTVPLSARSFSKQLYQQRLRGDPFGFATPENQLSGMQLSILGALGISRLR